MNIMLRAAIAAVSFASIGSAYAGEGEGTVANTLFTRSRAWWPRLRAECSAGRDGAERAGHPAPTSPSRTTAHGCSRPTRRVVARNG